MQPAEKPLRILAVINIPWDLRLGAARVWIELAEHWRAAGHTVDSYSFSNAYPRPSRSGAIFALRQMWFAARAAHFIRAHRHRYDVIDALLGSVAQPKNRLRFRGLLVARSVGFYWLYQRFDEQARDRWPDQARGKLIGRILYTMTRRRLLDAADQAVGHADVINLPNDDELASLRRDLRSDKAAIVQPYALTVARRYALQRAAATAEDRLAGRTICFIGMWSIRKGARDWASIVSRIRSAVPDANFRFLGTLTDDANVRRDLPIDACDCCEIIREYEPDELPELLRDCTVGIFPSYLEGFGFAVLEQLAAGIPTVAYDVPGPRQILRDLPFSCLVPAGDSAALSDRAIAILRMQPKGYSELREQSFVAAGEYSWPEIAAETIRSYREALNSRRGPIIFTQPFGIRSPGDGARFMRALLADSRTAIALVCTSPNAPPVGAFAPESHLPLRPSFGRLERTRFASAVHALARPFSERFTRRLEKLCEEKNARAIHSIAHGGVDFYLAFGVAQKLGIPFFLHVHNDFIYNSRAPGGAAAADHAMRAAWQGAAARFVNGTQLGEEYCRRYGTAAYIVITDGVETVAPGPIAHIGSGLHVYFMGLFHLEYEPNLERLLMALGDLQAAGARQISLTLRCGDLRRHLLNGYETLARVVPFGSEADVQADLKCADLLYLPLPFKQTHAPFVCFSLSTKLITYLASGLPILYHGPEESAVYDLLKGNRAAYLVTSEEEAALRSTLDAAMTHSDERQTIVENALSLAKSCFMLPAIRARFWHGITHSLRA